MAIASQAIWGLTRADSGCDATCMTRFVRLAVSFVALAMGARSSWAADVLIAGQRVDLDARRPGQHRFAFRSALDFGIAAPFPDPTAGATLRVFVSSAAGQCHAEIVLPAELWSPIGGDGAREGWRYRDRAGSVQGIRAVQIEQRRGGGRIAIKAQGAFPCGLEAPQSAPVRIELAVADARYCAAFGGTLRKNSIGKYGARNASAPTACLARDVTIASLNVLHGIFCPGTDGCRRADRIDLVRQFVVARGCPDILAFQEVFTLSASNENANALIAALQTACPAPYAAHAYHAANPFDDELVLSRYPIIVDEILDLLGPIRNVLHVRIDHPIGALDVYATHLASGSDQATAPCAGTFGPCPPECVSAGANTVRECQAVQMAEHIVATHDVPTVALAVGDFNAGPASFVYQQFVARGWTDTYLAAGNPECVPATGVGCTSGREDQALTDMENPALNESSRIDYVWRIPPTAGSLCSGVVEPAGDPDGDGVATRLFADEPNPFVSSCGPAPAAICWPSDHVGAQADINCD